MDAGTFKAAIYELSLYFERRLPGDETVRQWCNEVQSIPAGHVPVILSEVKKLETWPRNLPAVFWRLSSQIAEMNGENNRYALHPRRLHPKRYAKANCQKCHGEGLHPWPMDWPVRRDADGKMITRKFTPKALCECTDYAEYGF